MSTTTKPRTRNTSIKTAGRTPVTPSKTVYSLMVRIDWTTAKTVTITALEDFDMPAYTIDTRTGLVAADKTGKVTGNVSVKVLAGTTLHFVRSSFDGLYYVGRMSREVATCTCGHYQNRHECKHQVDILAAHYERSARERKQIAAAFVDASAAIESDDAEELLDEDQKLEKWTEQELAIVPAPETPATCLPYVNEEERATFWQAAGRKEHAQKIARGRARWKNFDRLGTAAQAV